MPFERGERVYLTGFMGAGKSLVGRRLAAALGWEFVDLDEQVEREAGLSVAEIFARHGETRFRELEHAALRATLDRSGLVVAVGGGALVEAEARRLVRGRGRVVWLKVPFATLAARVMASGVAARPLFTDEKRARELYRRRLPAYRRADLVIEVAPGQPVDETVARVRAELGVGACAT